MNGKTIDQSSNHWFAASVMLIVQGSLLTGCGAGGSDDYGDTCGDDPPISQPASSNNTCRALIDQCPHRGGDIIHNICADGIASRNVAWDGKFLDNSMLPDPSNPPIGRAGEGCDVSLAGRSFDALTWDSMRQHPYVWEVKTDDSATADDGNRQCRLRRFVRIYLEDCSRVIGCNKGINDPLYQFHYRMAFSDEYWFSAMNDYFAMHQSDLPVGASDFCEIYSAQGCR